MIQAARSELIGPPVLETERLILRAPQASDWPFWRDFMASDRSQYAGGPLDEPKAWRAFGHMIGLWVLRGFGNFVFCEKGSDTALGMTGPHHQIDWPERELGWTLWSTAAEGKGFAFEAACAARAYAFDVLGWETAVSYIAPENARSIALAKRLGAFADAAALTPNGKACLVFRHPLPANTRGDGLGHAHRTPLSTERRPE
ncbi:MAG: RimJ/RimL family protein N-acetyltransferase [Pseudorhodobacter sp.]|jgi:RimJ/RimL family protein N-acetyltransferase